MFEGRIREKDGVPGRTKCLGKRRSKRKEENYAHAIHHISVAELSSFPQPGPLTVEARCQFLHKHK